MATPKLKFDSKFEEDLYKGPLSGCEFHPERIKYTVEHTYQPDYVIDKYIIESKGRFRDRSEASKYLWIRKNLPRGKELVFVFMNHKTPMPHAKRRKKCGTKMTHGEWATKNKFVWFTRNTVPKEWSKK